MRKTKYPAKLCAAAAAALLSGCAAPAAETAAAASPAAVCVPVTGSGICRREGSGNPNPVASVSGDEIRATGAPVTGAAMGRTGN